MIANNSTTDIPLIRMVARAILLRCPRCGGRRILRSWFKLAGRCPTCELPLDRDEGSDYWLGGYAINFVVAEGTSAVVALIVLRAFWPNVTPALVVGVSMALLSPIAFFPFSRTLWLAVDLKLRRDADR